jgi:hypothetical protein
MGHTNFYEKALFVKTDVAVALCGRVQQSCVLFARAIASIRTFGEPNPLGGSVHYEIHLFGYTKALQSSDRSLLSDGPSSYGAVTLR